jgi:carbamoyltransferase
MYILGLNQYHGDSAAALIKDGQLIAAAEEERFNRIKHWAGFPEQAIRFCLNEANLLIDDIDIVCINKKPSEKIFKKMLFVLKNRLNPSLISDRILSRIKTAKTEDELINKLDGKKCSFKLINVEHHRAHLASAFFYSPFKESAALSVDGFGDFSSTMLASCKNNRLEPIASVDYPHSLGMFYLACTQYLGFPNYGDEYKVMGLSAYGEPVYSREMEQILSIKPDGMFELNMEMFLHSNNVEMSWNNTSPVIGRTFSDAMVRLLGPERTSSEEISKRHKDIAASVQAIYEKAFFSLLNNLHKKTAMDAVCIAGGCAQNSLANGKIKSNTKFKKIYVPPAGADSGGAIGAALYYWYNVLNNQRVPVQGSAYTGPSFNEAEIKAVIDSRSEELESEHITVSRIDDIKELCNRTALSISEGLVIGWFQGKMEWGPRALGNRSILCDPRRSDMKDILNNKIKRRESFRPFAPSIHREAVAGFFESSDDVPYMGQVFVVRKEKRNLIPAVTHVDGTGRLQTVTKDENPIYWMLINEFKTITGIPLVLNTSFNENEPIVCRPSEALDCFLRTKMDVLVLNNFLLRRN